MNRNYVNNTSSNILNENNDNSLNSIFNTFSNIFINEINKINLTPNNTFIEQESVINNITNLRRIIENRFPIQQQQQEQNRQQQNEQIRQENNQQINQEYLNNIFTNFNDIFNETFFNFNTEYITRRESYNININNIFSNFETVYNNFINDTIDEYIHEDVRVVVPENIFNNFEKIVINNENINIYQDKSCNICIEEFTLNETLTKLKCNHFFHQNCIKQWLTKQSKKCPICRDETI